MDEFMTMPNPSRRELLRAGAVIGAGAALAATPLARLAAQGTPADRWPHLAALAHRYVSERKVANMLGYIGFGARASAIGEGRDAFGGPRVSDENSLYRIYSMTKPITGAAAMMLIDEGKLELDQPLSDILPKFARMQVQKTYDGPITPDNLEPATSPITIRRLVTHTSGLGYPIVQSGPIRDAMMEAGVVTGLVTRAKIPQLWRGDPVPSLALMADKLAEFPLVLQPGTRWNYSMGLDLMGRVIEVVSGQSFDSFLQQRIFDPCGMSSTFFQVPASELFRLTTSYGVIDGAVIPIDVPAASVFAEPPPYPMGGSGLVSSPRDYDRFLRMLAAKGQVDGTRVMSEAAVQMGTSNLLESPDLTRGTSVEGYGFGAAGRVGGKDTPNFFGWAGAAGTVGFVDLATGLRTSLYTQYMPSFAYPVADEFATAVAADIAQLFGGGG